jgi:hypothetical protein
VSVPLGAGPIAISPDMEIIRSCSDLGMPRASAIFLNVSWSKLTWRVMLNVFLLVPMGPTKLITPSNGSTGLSGATAISEFPAAL